MIRIFIACLFIVVLAQASQAGELPQAAVKHAKKYLHVREKTGRNDAPEIDRMLAYLGLPKGLSWCAAFVIFGYKEAADELRVKQPWPRYGRVAMLWETCKRNPLKYHAITTEEVRLGIVRLQPGDLPVWANGTIRNRDFNGHIGLVVSQLSPLKIKTIEGNTSSGDKGSQRDGNGVFERTRAIAPGSFRIVGFCRARP